MTDGDMPMWYYARYPVLGDTVGERAARDWAHRRRLQLRKSDLVADIALARLGRPHAEVSRLRAAELAEIERALT